MHILICGGAGYIGSHMAKMLYEHDYEVTVFDNLSTGHRHALHWGRFIQGDLLDKTALKSLFGSTSFDAVMHFSARSLVGESMENPALYYENNVVGTFNLLEAMRLAGMDKFIFSSSAAVYGRPVKNLIDETHPQAPINPYGYTKLVVERMLSDFFNSYGFCSVSLRYFNAAGADPSGIIGEDHDPETHLIPNVLKAAALKKPMKVFGNNYPTKDGTCIRDYIHVNDLCNAHLLALNFIQEKDGAHVFNLGNGNGFSVLEVIEAAQTVTGLSIPYDITDSRPGDPAILVADSRRGREELSWSPEYTDIESIIQTAWIRYQ
jgi:UDP-glucose 4-epimerase